MNIVTKLHTSADLKLIVNHVISIQPKQWRGFHKKFLRIFAISFITSVEQPPLVIAET